MTTKQLSPIGIMSNLVGMYLYVLFEDGGKMEIKRTGFVLGKADECYIIQWHNAITGNPMNCQLLKLCDMMDWMFVPTRELSDYIMDDYTKHGFLRFSNLKKDQ